MQYYFQTSFGTFFISSAPYGGFNLKLDDDVINWSEKAEDLALQVYEKTSGFSQWDESNFQSPETLKEWSIGL